MRSNSGTVDTRAGLAQSVARQSHNLKVVSSSLTFRTYFLTLLQKGQARSVARVQVGELMNKSNINNYFKLKNLKLIIGNGKRKGANEKKATFI
jgi:hypothetical protein